MIEGYDEDMRIRSVFRGVFFLSVMRLVCHPTLGRLL